MDKEKLIEIVREYRCLYDNNDKYYSDVDKKELAWKEIGVELQQPPDACKQTWNCIRDGFRRTLKKKKRTGGNCKKWKFEDELFFLIPFLKERDRNSSVGGENANPVTVFEDTWNASTIKYDENTGEHDDSDDPETLSEREVKPSNSSLLRRPLKRRIPQTKSSLLLNYILNEKRSKSDSMDDVDLFFASIAKTVKQLSPINRALTKQKVFTLVSGIEMEELRHKD